MSQLDLFGNAIPAEEVDWPASLRYLSTIERERGIKLDADEAGALIHARRDKHDAETRCRYCTTDGAEALDRLRNRRPLEAAGSAGEPSSARLTDTEPAASSGPGEHPETEPPRARSTDPDTSHEAALSVQNVTDLQARIVEILEEAPDGLTDVAIAYAYAARHDWPAATPSGLRTRRKELVDQGRVIPNGSIENLAKRRMIVWALARGRGPVHDPEPEL